MAVDVIGNISSSCSGLGDVQLNGIKLEDAKRDLLDVTTGSIDQHVAMQPAAMAYYFSLKKLAKRRLDNLISAYDRWEKKQYSIARAAVESGTVAKSAIKVEDVKARFITDNEPEIVKWEDRIEKAQSQYDDLDSWCEAWKQKSFSIREFVSLEEDERSSGGPSIMGQGRQDRQETTRPIQPLVGKQRVLDLIKKRRESTISGV